MDKLQITASKGVTESFTATTALRSKAGTIVGNLMFEVALTWSNPDFPAGEHQFTRAYIHGFLVLNGNIPVPLMPERFNPKTVNLSTGSELPDDTEKLVDVLVRGYIRKNEAAISTRIYEGVL